MPQAIAQHYKRKIKALEDLILELQYQSDSLEILRAHAHIFDALAFYIQQPHLSQKDIADIRTAMCILTRGTGN